MRRHSRLSCPRPCAPIHPSKLHAARSCRSPRCVLDSPTSASRSTSGGAPTWGYLWKWLRAHRGAFWHGESACPRPMARYRPARRLRSSEVRRTRETSLAQDLEVAADEGHNVPKETRPGGRREQPGAAVPGFWSERRLSVGQLVQEPFPAKGEQLAPLVAR